MELNRHAWLSLLPIDDSEVFIFSYFASHLESRSRVKFDCKRYSAKNEKVIMVFHYIVPSTGYF